MKTYSIQIPKPCSEKPSNFSPSKSGGFCAACQKEVIDFRKMSNEEVLDFIRQNPDKKCGMFSKDQIQSSHVISKRVASSPVFLMGVLGILGIATPTFAQTQQKPKVEIEAKSVTNTSLPSKGSDVRVIKGKILSAFDKSEIPGATILVVGTKVGTSTDLEGKFELEVPVSYTQNKITLAVSFIGYCIQEREVLISQIPIDLGIIYLSENDIQLIGEVIVINQKKNFWQRMKGLFRNEEKANCSNESHKHTVV